MIHHNRIVWSVLAVLIFFTSVSFHYYLNDKKKEPYTLQYPSYFGPMGQQYTDTLQTSVINLGRFLFYDKRLSGNNTVSCGSCHLQEFAFTDNKTLSDGVEGKTSRNSMSLTNLLWHGTFFWDGRAHTLEEQALIPIQNKIEMNQNLDSLLKELSGIAIYRKLFFKAYGNSNITPEKIARAIAQFETTIISSDSRFDKYLSGDTGALSQQEKKGYKLFNTIPDPRNGRRGAGCTSCHSSALLLGNLFQNNGLDSIFLDKGVGVISENPHDNGKFNVPSLRNIALTAPYMHDGRFKTLHEVLAHYNGHISYSYTVASFLPNMSNDINGKKMNLRPEEIESIIAFLKSLSDEELANKKEYSDPF